MADTWTMEEKWGQVAKSLVKAGVDTAKIAAKMQQRLIIQQAEADGVIGADEPAWDDFADALIEEHPTWALPEHTRRKNAESLMENWDSQDLASSEMSALELAEGNRYALVTWYEGSSYVRAAGNSYADICEAIYDVSFSSEYPEHCEFYVDLEEGGDGLTQHQLYRPGDDAVTTSITLTLHGESYTYDSDRKLAEDEESQG